jgi:hypothetical protein
LLQGAFSLGFDALRHSDAFIEVAFWSRLKIIIFVARTCLFDVTE